MWKTVKLGDLLEVQNGYAFNSKQFDVGGEMPLIRIRDLKNAVDTETRYTGDYDEKYLVSSGDLLIGMDGEFRCYEWRGAPALLNQRVCRLQNFHDDLNQRFLLYAINDELKKIEDVTGFTTVKHLSSKTIKEIKLQLPPLPEQKRIVAKLDAAFAEIDRAIDTVNQSIETALSLRKSTFATVTERSGSHTITQALGDLFKLSSGKFLPKKKMNTDGSISVIGGNGLAGNHDKANLSGKNVVIGRVGAKCGNVHFFDEDIWLTDNAMYAHSFSFEFDKEFLALALTSLNLGAYARQAAQPVISFSSIKDVSLTFPLSVSEQREIVSNYNEIQDSADSFIEVRSKKKIELNCLKSAILAQELQPPESKAA